MISGLPQRSTWLGGQSDAALRMFQLASGLLSDVPGERSILNQFQAARRAAQRAGWCGRRLGELSRRAMEAGERVRARAAQSATILELSDLVLDVLLHESRLACTPVADRRPRVLLLGAGEVARSIHGALMGAGVCGITWATRRPTRHRGKCIPLPQARERIGEFDVVIAALADAAGLIDAAQLPQSTISVDVSVPAAMTGARWPLGRILEHAAAKLSAQREALRRASHGLAGLADAALAEVVAPSIAPAALSITAFRNQIVDRELARLAPILNALPDLQAQALRKSIRHTAARCVHPLHETVNQLARHGRWQQAVTMIDHLLGSRVGWESIDSPAHGAGDHERGEASRSNPAPESA